MNYDSVKDIVKFLDSKGFSMKKRFGQNFLVSRNVREKIIRILSPEKQDVLWEIGPGLGAMTDMLVDETKTFTLFEIDHGFVDYLSKTYSGKVNIISGDFLKTWKGENNNKPDKIIGNLPYCCSSAIIADIAYENVIPDKMVFTVQKELAERMTSKPGNKNYSSFSVLCSFAYDVKYHGDIAGGAFYPVPEVVSSIIELVPNKSFIDFQYREAFFLLIRDLFKSRRKTIRNNLLSSSFASKFTKDQFLDALEKCDISPSDRAEVLKVEKFLELAELLH